jgi:hypothetical protein
MLPAVCYILHPASCILLPMPFVFFLLPANYYQLSSACCLVLPAAFCLLPAFYVHCLLLIARSLLFLPIA